MSRTNRNRFRPRLESLETIFCLDGAPIPVSPIPVMPSPIPTNPFEAGGPLDQLIFGPDKWNEPHGDVPMDGEPPPCLANSCPGDAPIGSPYLISSLAPPQLVA